MPAAGLCTSVEDIGRRAFRRRGVTTVSACRDVILRLLDSGTPNLGDGVLPSASPGMTAAQTLQGQPTPGQDAMPGDRFDRVGRATRRKPAMAKRSKNKDLCRRNRPSVYPQTQDENVLPCVHFPPRSFNSPAFLRLVKKSLSTSANSLPAIEGRATRTNSKGCVRSY